MAAQEKRKKPRAEVAADLLAVGQNLNEGAIANANVLGELRAAKVLTKESAAAVLAKSTAKLGATSGP